MFKINKTTSICCLPDVLFPELWLLINSLLNVGRHKIALSNKYEG